MYFHDWKMLFAITLSPITCITKRDVKVVVHWAFSCLGTAVNCPEQKVECVS